MFKKIEINHVEIEGKSPLYFAENFDINLKRIFYVLDMKQDEVRGAHAHKKTSQLIFVISGVLELEALNENRDVIVSEKLNKYSQPILFEPNVWLNLKSLEDRTSFICLADLKYIEEDYIRNPDDFFKKNA